jgi:hypothetical protein
VLRDSYRVAAMLTLEEINRKIDKEGVFYSVHAGWLVPLVPFL